MKKAAFLLAIALSMTASLLAESVDFDIVSDEPAEARLDIGLTSTIQFRDPVIGSAQINIGFDLTTSFEMDFTSWFSAGASVYLSLYDLYDLGASSSSLSYIGFRPYLLFNLGGEPEALPTNIILGRRSAGGYDIVDYIDPDIRMKAGWGIRAGTALGISLTTGNFSGPTLTSTFVGIQFATVQTAQVLVGGVPYSIDEGMCVGLDLRNGSSTQFAPVFKIWADFDLSGFSYSTAITLDYENTWIGMYFGIPINFRTGLFAE